MRKKVSCFSTRVWAGFLALLGFASCTSNEIQKIFHWNMEHLRLVFRCKE